MCILMCMCSVRKSKGSLAHVRTLANGIGAVSSKVWTALYLCDRPAIPYGMPLDSQHRAVSAARVRWQVQSEALKTNGLETCKHGFLAEFGCVRARGGRLAWLQGEGVVNTRTRLSCKREVQRPLRSVVHFWHPRSVPYQGSQGWLAGPLKGML
jgi:hypothetical protein